MFTSIQFSSFLFISFYSDSVEDDVSTYMLYQDTHSWQWQFVRSIGSITVNHTILRLNVFD